MTTSGSATFNASVLQMIDGALRKCGQLGDDETTAGAGAVYTNTALALNSLIKTWQAMGLHVWTEEEGILFPQPGQYRYLLGTSAAGVASPDLACDWQAYAYTATTAGAALGANQITVGSVAGMTVGEHIAVQLSTGPLQKTAIQAIAGNVVTLFAVLTAAVNAGALVIAADSNLGRPLRISNARLLSFQGVTPTETPLQIISRQEYMDLPQKSQLGRPNSCFYAPKMNQGELYLWPAPQQAIYGVRFTWLRALQDVTDPAQTFDFPQEWITPLTWALAEQIGPEYDIVQPRWEMIRQMAAASRDMAESWDRESEPVQFGMAWG